jgi:hypothetical protein
MDLDIIEYFLNCDMPEDEERAEPSYVVQAQECTICTNDSTVFVACKSCTNKVCVSCWDRITPANKCPFCRAKPMI